MKSFLRSTPFMSCELRAHGQKQQLKKMDKVKLYFQYLKEKQAYRYFFSMSDKESRSARKRMWKITSGVFIVLFLRVALERP